MRQAPASPQEERAARGRRGRGAAPLTQARIVAAALSLAARDGLGGLTTRKLGKALGVEAMSIYHHFPSKRHLHDALVDHAIGSIAFPPPGPPLRRLRALCIAYRAMAHRHAALYPLIGLHRLNTPAGVRFLERALSIVHEAVPDAGRAARQFRAIGYYLMGAAFDETAGYARGPSAAEPVDEAFVALHCPRLAAASPYFARDEWDATFEAGLDALLAGLAATSVTAHAPRASRAPPRGRQPRGPTS